MQIDKYGVPTIETTDAVSPLQGLLNPAFTALGNGMKSRGLWHVSSSQADRDTFFGTPTATADQLALQNAGAICIRTDTGTIERYYAAYNSSTNPGGSQGGAGWYQTISGDTGWVTSGVLTAASDWTLNSYKTRKVGSAVYLLVDVTRTGAAISVPADGNIPNTTVAQTAWAPSLYQGGLGAGGTGRGVFGVVGATGLIQIVSVAGSGNINTGDELTLAGSYLL